MSLISEDIALIISAANLVHYPVLGVKTSTDMSGAGSHACALLIRDGAQTCHSWNPIDNEQDLYEWLLNLDMNPFHFGFECKFINGYEIGIPDGYEPRLGEYADKKAHSRELLGALVNVKSVAGDEQ